MPMATLHRTTRNNSTPIHLLGIVILLFVTAFQSFGQRGNALLKEGNTAYRDSAFDKAAEHYTNAAAKGADPFISRFNLGDALYKQGKFEEAANQFKSLPELTSNENRKAQAYHNLGNAYLQQKKYAESIEAFKQSLRNKPDDLETKYNLTYAKRMLQQEQQQQQQNKNQDQKNQDQQKQEQQKQDQQKEQDKKDQQQKQQQDQQKQDNKEGDQKQPRPDQMSKQDAERMLDAMNKDEQDIRQRLEKQRARTQKVPMEKDW